MSSRSIVGSQQLKLGDESIITLTTTAGSPTPLTVNVTCIRSGKIVTLSVGIGIVAIAVNSSVYTFNELLPLEYRPLNFIEAYPMVVFGGFGVGLFGCFKVLATGEITIAAGASIFSTFTLGDNVGWNALSITYIVQ